MNDPKGNLRSELLAYADTVKRPLRRKRIQRIANNPQLLTRVEKNLTSTAHSRYGKDLSGFTWAEILKALMPAFLQFLEQLLKELLDD